MIVSNWFNRREFMTYLWLGALLFGGLHLFSTVLPAQRNALRGAVGEKAWKGAYSLLVLLGVVFFVLAYRSIGEGDLGEMLYQPWVQGKHLVMLLIWLMFILLGASHGKGYIKSYVRHPMSLGIALWSGGHLLVNGERALVWLFGTFFVVAIADLIFSFARGKRPTHEPRLRSDIVAVVAGTVLYLIFLFGFHPYVLGVPVVG
jgi:uncharacterized membrane protein